MLARQRCGAAETVFVPRVSSQCAIKCPSVSEVSVVNGARTTPLPSPPSTAGRRLPPLRALRQNVPGSTRRGLKALSPVHRLHVAPGSLATRLDRWSLHAERGEHKGSCVSQPTGSIGEVAVRVGSGVTFHAEPFIKLSGAAWLFWDGGCCSIFVFLIMFHPFQV